MLTCPGTCVVGRLDVTGGIGMMVVVVDAHCVAALLLGTVEHSVGVSVGRIKLN